MIYKKYFIFVNLLLVSFCLCEISVNQKVKLLNGIINYYNNLPNQIYTCDEGSLKNTQQVDDTTYKIIANLKVKEIRNIDLTKLLKCTATIQDSDNKVTVISNQCQEHEQQSPVDNGSQEQTPEAQVEVTDPTFERNPIKLENEVQSDTAITSGEQFIAIPRDQPSAPCIGCASHVNPQAAGVSDLAILGIRHLDIHEPAVKHTLDSVIDVERQVQVVSGVQYILTLSIKFDSCVKVDSVNCASSKTCRITVLVKPWVKLPNGANYRAILGNNCTEKWQYGDNGEVLPEPPTDNHVQNLNADDIQVKHNTDVQAQPNQEKSLTDEEIKNLQDQIIPNSQFQENTVTNREVFENSPDTPGASKQHVFKTQNNKYSENSIPASKSGEGTQQTFSVHPDKKKVIDEMLDFFDFSGLKPKIEVEEVIPRVRRSYDYDLQVLSLADDFHGIKKSLENARFMYEMAQYMVNYLNEMDMEIKNRAVKNVIKAEEELENLQRFVYVQALVAIPCDKVECQPRDVVNQICNGVIDSTNEKNPQILNTFCYNDNKERDYRDVIKEVSLDDPVLQRLVKESVRKIESEMNSPYALKVNKIVSAITQVTSGRLTKISVVIESIQCNKTVPWALRANCTVLQQLGSKICEIIIHERHWLKEQKISYTCTDRPVDMRISKSKSVVKNITVDDPKIIEMLQEAIQYLETQSVKNNKLKIVNIKSISSQIIAGFLTKIEFVVGYTNCTDENDSRDEFNKCELLNNEGLRLCKAQIWDRSWIIDGRQVEVSCDDVEKSNEIEKARKKRSVDNVGSGLQQSGKKNNNDYMKLAHESLKKFLHSSSSRQHYDVVKVERVTTKDVPEKLIKIEFSISPTNCLMQVDGHPSLSKCDIVNPNQIFQCRSKILERSWLDKTQYFVNCNTKDEEQQTNFRLNGLKEHNPSDTKYYKLAEESLQKYLNDTGNTSNHKILRIDKVTTQIVSGLLTSIDFVISNQNKVGVINCHSNILEKHWLGTKDYNVSCHMQENKNSDVSIEVKPDNLKYMHIAVESLQKYLKYKPDSHLVRVSFVDKVIKAGDITKIVFIASQAEDDNGDTICYTEFSELDVLKSDNKVTCFPIGAVLGKTEIGENDQMFSKYLKLADESLHKYLQTINNSQVYTVMSIENVTVQWDEGIKTLINFIATPIDSDSTDLQGMRCLSQVVAQPWLYYKHIYVECEDDRELYRTKREATTLSLKGGLKDQDPAKSEFKLLAQESLKKYIHDFAITTPLKLLRVEKVASQVVAGTLTRIDFIVSDNQQSNTFKCHSTVWDRPWLNERDINVSCENDKRRTKRQIITGGLMDQNPNDPKYKQLAEESLNKYVHDSGITTPHKVVRIEKVTTQVVAGSLTRIDFIVSDSQESYTLKCHSEVWDRPWLNERDINVSCENDKRRTKRQIITGGLMDQNPNDPKYKQLAEESLNKYVYDSGITTPHKVVRIEQVTTQVVAGSLTRIDFIVSDSQESYTLKCHSEVWDRPWLNKKEIDVSCEDDNHRVKRQIPGGEKAQDPSKPEYKRLAEESLDKYVHDSGITTPHKVVRIEKVTTQVVAGTLTSIEFIVSDSQESYTLKCVSKVWDRPWLNKKEIDVSCEDDNHRVKRQIAGGEKAQDPSKPEYKRLAEESLNKYVHDSGITTPHKVVRIEKVTTQVVAGTLTAIDFIVSDSQESYTLKCVSKVWDRPWLNKKEIDVSCEDDDHRVKRQIPGGEKAQDPSKPEYKRLAEESLNKYVLDSGITTPHKVVRIEKVTTQVVAGTLTAIDFIVSDTLESYTLKCVSKVWDRPWLNKKEIDVSCEDDDHRVKRQIPGGEKAQDPSKPEYKRLAEESLNKYVLDSGITTPHKVVRIEKVTTQVVAGSLTRIDFIVSDSQESYTLKCHSEVWGRPWLNKKEIDVSCEDDNHRVKRQIAGGEKAQDPSKPEYKRLAEESLNKYVLDSGITTPHKVVRIEKVTTQVVAGTLTAIDFIVSDSQESYTLKCVSKVWDRPWLNKKEIDVSCEDDDHRVKRQIPGGEKAQDPSKPEYKRLAEESLNKYVLDSGITTPHKVVRIEKVTTQVVAGTLTAIDFIVSDTLESYTLKCVSKVWDRPWLNKKEIDVSCEDDDHRVKRQIPGGEKAQDPSKPEYKRLAEESLSKYVHDSGITTPHKVVRIEKVTTQVVAGSLTRIDFIVSDILESYTLKCVSKVWDRPWLNKKEIDVSCEDDNHRVKRQIAGGEKAQDPSKPEYKRLAEESLNKYVHDSGITTPHKVVRIEKVTTQVVAGTLTAIDFIVSDSQESYTLKCVSKVWDRPWLNKKEIDVSCEDDDHRVKRQIPGGEKAQDPSKPEYKRLAEESLSKYILDSGITTPHKVVRIEKVTTQVVAGTLTAIDFIVSDSQESYTLKCVSKVWDRPWLNKKEIDVSCEDDDHRVKRQIPGGEKAQDPSKPEYKRLAEESLNKYVLDSGITTPHKVVRIEKVTTQVVAGSLTRIDFIVSDTLESYTLKCVSKVWDRPWLNKKEIDVSCEDDNHRVKRQIPGGEKAQDPSKPEYKRLAEESLSKYILDSGITTPHKVVRIEKVTTQVVAGTLTAIDFIVSDSQESYTLKCVSKVWDRPWLNKKEIDVSCEDDDHRVKRQIPGGEKAQDPSKPEYKRLAEESLNKYVLDSGITTPHKVVRIEKVTTQVVAGSLTRIDFIVSDTLESYTLKCVSKVWDRPWLNKKEIDVSCEDDDHRVKRQIPGGEKAQDPSKPEYKRLAEESLNKYVLDSGITTPHKVVRIEKVTTQVVAGSLTRIDFIVSDTLESYTLICVSKVWDRPWLNKKEIDVSCEDDNHRVKRQIAGGEKAQDPSKPEYKRLAEESLNKYVHDSGITTPHKVVRIEKVTTQVVAGTLTAIDFIVSDSQESYTLKCVSKVWDRPWLNKKEIDVSCEDDDHRVKRQIPGGEKAQDPSKPEYKRLAEESLNKYVLDSGITTPHKVVRIEKVTTQVVAGTLTAIDFIVSDTLESYTLKCVSKVWDRPWLNKKEIDVSCEDDDHRVKRQIPGGEKAQDPSKPEYKRLAEESLSKYVHDSGITTPHKVVRIEKVTTQVVAGTLTAIDFIVSDSQESYTLKCVSKVWDRPWLNKKEIDVSCEDDDHRVKRQIPGGEKAQDPSKPEYKRLAEESLNKYVLDSGITTPHKVVRIEKVTTQVVAGTLTAIDFIVSDTLESYTLKCVSKVWDRPWLNKKEIDVSCEDDDHRVKRQIPGGEKAQDPSKPEYKRLAEESLSKYILDSGITTPHKVVRIEKVTTQVVAGTLTAIDFIVSDSQESYTLKCVSKVWDRPWLNKKEIDVSCEDDDHRVKRQIPGGEKAQDPSKPEYKRLAEESLSKYILDSGITTPHKVVRIEKVTTQVVAGTLTAIDFIVSDSQESYTLKCVSKVWDRPWLNKKEIDVSCEDDDHRVKRQIPGGEKAQDPSKPEYKRLAEESLSKYILDSGITTPHKVVRIEKVTTQVVAGSMIRIDFIVSDSQESYTLKCVSKVWDRPWLNKKEIDVSCEDDDHRVKRQIPGGEKAQDPSKPEYKRLAEESLSKYILDSGITTPHKVVRIEKVTTQVVAGSLTRIDFIVSDTLESYTLKCVSKVWDRPWLNKKEIDVSCEDDNHRVKRQIHGDEKEQHRSSLRGHFEETQDPNKPEYKLLAEESLRKYQQKNSVYHKVVGMKRVVTRVVSGIKYKIDFNASPTTCSVNVTNVYARSCKPIDGVILNCHTEIWDRPWLKSKKIDIDCYGPDEEDFNEYESESDLMDTASDLKQNDDKKYRLLAEEASDRYLTISNRKYVHKVTDIHSVSEHIAEGTITKIEYSLSPTVCLRNETRGSNDSCPLKKPVIVLHCNANIWDRPWLRIEKQIKVTCKKMSKPKTKKHKRELGDRTIRQIGDEDDDDEIAEEIAYYYADRAVQHVNDQSSSNNLHKLITIHAVQSSAQMGVTTVRMYIDIAETFCLRNHKDMNLNDCEEMDGLKHRLCLARLWPSPDDELVVRHVSVVCDDEEDFVSITGVNIPELLRMAIEDLERSPDYPYKLVHQGDPQVLPTLDSKLPFKINFIIATTNCSKDVNLEENPFQCYINTAIPSKACHAFIWLNAETKFIRYINAKCTPPPRSRRSLSDPANLTLDNIEIQKLVTASLEKLEMSSMYRYKQRILQINSYSTKLTSGKVTTIDFDVGYTSCLKYEWVENITSCDFLEHLPRRRCVAQIWERLWINNGKNIDVKCVDDETPLESHIEFESAEMANELAKEALKHIEAKYPHSSKQKVVRIFSLEKQVVAGIHFKMKVEVGFTDCVALTEQTNCKLLPNVGVNKFCRINVWVRPWTDHPPNFRVSCDFQEGSSHDFYHQVQAEHLFYHFLTTYSPSYQNDYTQMQKRFEIFKNNIKKIHEFNVHEKGTATYGVTRFADLTYEEFRSTYMGLKTNLSDANQIPMKQAGIPDIKIPQNFDWREYDAVTEVKDQGSCGSCWAFSVTGNIEGQWKMQSGQLVSLSEQELVDCDKLDDGCNGGLPDNAYRAIEQMGGLELESDYPYEGVDEKCEFNKTLAKVQISSAVNITTNETGMAQWLVQNGPISIGINANAMQFYMGGISHPWKALCSPKNLDHGVLIVGYGVKDYPLFHKQLPYWIVKNSWGKSWGEQGYYRVYRGDGTCGVNQMASSAVI